MKTIAEQIFDNALKTPDKVAVTDGSLSLTYSELVRQIAFARKRLVEVYGLKKGDAVIIAANKQLSFVSVYFACHILGVTALPIAPDTNERRFTLIYNKVMPKLVIGFTNEALNLSGVELGEFEGFIDETVFEFPSEDLVADIIFTTGTTGEPKGVTLSHKNISAAALNINTFIKNSPDDVEMLALPISHSFGLGRLRCALSYGQTVVILGSFANMKRFFRFMEEFKVTGFGMVPASWAMIKKLSGEKIADYKNQLHYIEIGSAPMPIPDKKLLIGLLPDTRICMHYGLTEASRSAFMEFHEEADRLDTIGKQSPNMYIKICDDNGNTVPDNAEGEICVKGDAVTKGYYLLPEVNASSYFGEYFRTGDWGVRDKDGYLKLCSRKKELINVGGKKVSPMEVEQVLSELNFIDECVCVGMADPEEIMGEVVKAFVVTSEPSKIVKEEINGLIAGKLEDYKVPAAYEVIDAIPKTSSGKIQRLQLKK